GFIAFPNFQVLSLSTFSVFECANMLAPEPLYDLLILSETGGPIRTSSGLTLETERFDEKEFDTLIVPGTLVDEPTFSPGLLAYVRAALLRGGEVSHLDARYVGQAELARRQHGRGRRRCRSRRRPTPDW